MDSESELKSLFFQILSVPDGREKKWKIRGPLIIKIISLLSSMDLDSQPKPESELISLIKRTISAANSRPNSRLVSFVTQAISLIRSIESDPDTKQESEPELMSLTAQIYSFLENKDSDPWGTELPPLLDQIVSLVESPEIKLISLIKKVMPLTDDTQLLPFYNREPLTDDVKFIIPWKSFVERDAKVISLIVEIITLVNSSSLPESELMSVVTQTISFFNSMDLDSQPEPLRKLISILSQKYFSDSELELALDWDWTFTSLVHKTLHLEPEPKLISLILEIVTLVFSMHTKWENLISLCPRLDVSLKDGKFHVGAKYLWNGKLECLPSNWVKFWFTGGELASHFLC